MYESVKLKTQIVVYLFFAFFISWTAVLMIDGLDGILNRTTPIAILGMAMLLGTGAAGIGLIGLFDGKSGYRRVLREMIKWRVALKWWLIAILTIPGTIAASVLILSPILSNPEPVILGADNKFSLVITSFLGGVFIALFEEIGWTGFLVPKLRKRASVIYTGVFVGFIWGLWHLILFIESDTFTTLMGLILLIVRLFTTLPVVRIIMVMIYDKTKSFLVTMFVHISFVFSMMLFEPVLTNNEMIMYILVRTFILILVAIGIIKTQLER